MKYAVQAVILNDKGQVLGVSRKDDHNDFGLVGGKVDPEDEDYNPELFCSPQEHAMHRECMEETGLDVDMYTAEIVFQMHKDGYMGITYLIKDWVGKIQTDEPHVVKWVSFSEIMKGSFGKWNTMVAESLESMGVDFLLNPIVEKTYYFHLGEFDDVICVAIVSKDFWDENGHLCDHYPDTTWHDIKTLADKGGFNLDELAESQFQLTIAGKPITFLDRVEFLMLNAGFEQNKDFSNYLD